MLSRISVAVLLVSVVAALAVAQEKPAESADPAFIIIPTQAQPVERRAAEELATHLKMITGKDFPLQSEEKRAGGGRAFVVGRTQSNLRAHNPDKWPADTIYIGYGSSDIAIVGEGTQGTLFAAYELLHDLGCRWYVPDNVDDPVIPKREQLNLPDKPKQHTPSFSQRGWHGPIISPGAFLAHHRDWAVRNRLNTAGQPIVDYGPERGHGFRLRGGHTLIVMIPSGDHPDAVKTFAQHPEWYPLVAGKRVLQYKDGRPVQACISNPQVVQEAAGKVIEYFQQNPGCMQFSVSHNDEPTYWCECEVCRKMDGPQSTWKQNNLLDAYGLRSKTGPGPMSTRWVTFVNQVAKIVGEACPGKRISFFAYGSTVAPPRNDDWKLEPNIVVEYAYGDGWCLKHSEDDPGCRVNSTMGKWLREWASRGNPVLFYDYPPTGSRFDIPVGFTKRYQSLIAFTKKAGATGWSGEGQGSWPSAGLWQYLKARLLWDVNTDVDALIAQYCRDLYGPAAESMKSFYLQFDSELQKIPGDVVYGDWALKLKEPTIDALSALIDQAQAKADTDPIRRRVTMMRVAMNGLYMARMADQIKKPGAAALLERYNNLRKQTLELIEKYTIPVSDSWRDQLAKSLYRPPFEAMDGKEVAALPSVWRFRTDPKNEGLNARWFEGSASGNEWRDLRVDTAWTEQGVDYHGAAWYATALDVPGGASGQFWLLFGAIDGEAELWIDRKSAGKLPLRSVGSAQGV